VSRTSRPRAPPRMSQFRLTHTAPTATYTLSLHDALPISRALLEEVVEAPGAHHVARYIFDLGALRDRHFGLCDRARQGRAAEERSEEHTSESSHQIISYAVFCLKKKKQTED